MKLSAFSELLHAHGDKSFRIVLPHHESIPACFHITEVAYIQKRFVDCGGRLHTAHKCQLQVWVSTDTDHRLNAKKLAKILDLAGEVMPQDQDLDLEIEYEDVLISQYPVDGFTVTEDAVELNLTLKHTDCLAKDRCLPVIPLRASVATEGCCGGSCGC